MLSMRILILIGLILISGTGKAQSYIFPVIKNYGGIYDITDAIEKPDPDLQYNIVIDLATGSEPADQVHFGLNNIARMINLHYMGGVPKENLNIIVAVHNEATYTLLDNDSYRARYKKDNPNLTLYDELCNAGVKFFVCGQSLISRKVDPKKIHPQVGIATSMLTVFTTYQLKGYAALKF
jgi:intracellular sulfur oxidation DsrE/DsrF family protein